MTYFWFTPTRTGTFEVLCAELCGLGHAFMRGVVVVDTEAGLSGLAGRAADLRATDGAAADGRGGLIEETTAPASRGATGKVRTIGPARRREVF